MANITKIEQHSVALKKRKRVAAYARVSMESDRMWRSLSAQISHYSEYIQSNPEWEYAGVYSDNGISGTKADGRTEFQRMIADCEKGLIDIILCKSISRFARNTVDLLETVRHLKDIGVEVRFEKENINSMSGDGELMLTLLASFAQEESRSISENVKWGTRKRFEKGIPNGRFQIYGYRWEGDRLVVEPEEANIVKLIYDNYLNGLSAEETEKQLEEMGVKSHKGKHFDSSTIRRILSNITYTGNLLLQKNYVSDPIIGKKKINQGELPQYFVENTHEAIIPMEIWQTVQEEKKRRRELGPRANKSLNTCCFTGKIKCGQCGKTYRCQSRNLTDGTLIRSWHCADNCGNVTVRENILKEIICGILGLEEFSEEKTDAVIERITVEKDDKLIFHFYDGSVQEKKWVSATKNYCWTQERRKAWRELHKSANRRCFSVFAGAIRCGQCGENYRRQSRKLPDSTLIRTWHCANRCGNISIREDILKEMIRGIPGLKEFTEIERITVNDSLITFHFLSGRTETAEYIRPKKKGTPHTEEYKKHMSELMTSKRKEGKMHGSKKSNDHSGNDK